MFFSYAPTLHANYYSKRKIKFIFSMIYEEFGDCEYLFKVPEFSFKEKVLVPFGGVVTIHIE